MAILALDVGRKKIGVAISESELISSAYCTIDVKDDKSAVGEIIFLVKRNNIDKLIIGLPKNMDETESNETKHVREFAKIIENKLKQYKLKTKIYFEDERLTSKEAERLLFEKGMSKEKIRANRDKMAAKLILDQYLDKI